MTHKEFYNELKTAASSSEYMTRMNFDEEEDTFDDPMDEV